MSGLFLNFYQVDIPAKTASIDSVEYSPYASKEAFIALKENFPDLSFYRNDDKILIWKKTSEAGFPENTTVINIDFTENVKEIGRAHV